MEHSSLHLQPAQRPHLVDEIFDQLAAVIFKAELYPGSALPPERVLAEQFGVSRIMVRQAVHRLAEVGLVQVRQGGATVVSSPETLTDPRALALLYRLAAHLPAWLRADLAEKQLMQGLSMVAIASRRADGGELDEIAQLVEQVAADPAQLARFDEFEARFWSALAEAGANRVFQIEVSWWQRVLAARPLSSEPNAQPPKRRIVFHRELIRRLQSGEDPVGYYLASIQPLLDELAPRRRKRS